MTYEAPSFIELRMDAEIGSYQEDFEFDPEQPPFLAMEPRSASEPSPSPASAR